MKKWIFLFGILCATAVLSGAQNLSEAVRAAAFPAVVQNSQFDKMKPSVLSEDEVSVLSAYLFNMYMVAEHNTLVPEALSLNETGVLDPLMHLKKSFPAERAHKIYLKNQARVQEALSFMFRLAGRPYPNDAQAEEAWALALQQASAATRSRQRISYAMPEELHLQGEYDWADVSFLVPALRMAAVESENKAVLFEKTQATLEDLDTRLAAGGGRNKPNYTYRWVKDECEYSSYVLAEHLLQTAASEPEKWGKTRVYKITARPSKETFYLRPVQGERFVLADGTQAAKWQYHTAVLLVLHTQAGDYIPVVLDSFLGKTEEPFTLAQWSDFFDKTTRFEVVAFEKNKKIDEALKTPQSVNQDGKIIRINGRDYKPAPIEE